MGTKLAAVAILAILGESVVAQDAPPRAGRLEVPLTSQVERYAAQVGQGLRLEVVRATDANGRPFGWDVDVLRISDDESLFDALCAPHGPCFKDVYAWSTRTQYYTDERRVQIGRPPVEVVIRLVGAKTTTPSDVYLSAYAAGELVITWAPVQQKRRGVDRKR